MAVAKSSAPLSRADVVSEVSAKTQMPNAQVDQVIRAFEDSLKRTLSSGGEVRMAGLGTFKVSDRAARMGRNPKTGEPLQIAASKNVRFSAGKAFKDAIGGPKSGSDGKAKAGATKAVSGKAAAGLEKAAVAFAEAEATPATASAKAAPAKAAKAAAPSKAAAAKGGKKAGKK